MIKALDFISLEAFNALVLRPDMAVISIGDPASTPPKIPDGIWAYRAEFLDMTPGELTLYGLDNDCLPTRADVAGVLAFAAEVHDSPQDYRLVIHCRMGISRSAAIALMAYQISRCHFPRWHDAFEANSYLLELGQAHLGQTVCRPEPPLPGTNWNFSPPELLI